MEICDRIASRSARKRRTMVNWTPPRKGGAMKRIVIHAVVCESRGYWVAHCLEYYIVSVTERLEDLPNELLEQILEQIEADRECGMEPLSGFKPAPKKYWDMFEEARAKRISQRQGVADSLEIETQLFAVAA